MKPFIYLLYLSILLFGSSSISAQTLHVWEQKIGNDLGTNDSYGGKGFFVHENSPQQYVVMSATFPYTADPGNIRWMVLDSVGQALSEQKYTTPPYQNNYLGGYTRADAILTSDGGYAYVDIFGTGDDTLALTKLDANGLLQWQQIYPSDTTLNTVFFTTRLQELNNGDYLILKEFDHPSWGGSYRIIMQRVTSTGLPIWENTVYTGNRPSSNIGNQKTLGNPDYIYEQANGNLVRIYRRRGYVFEYDSAGNLIMQVDSTTTGVSYRQSVPIDTGSNGLTRSAGVYAVTQTVDDGFIAVTDEFLVEFDSTLRIKRIETIGIATAMGSLPIEEPHLRSVIRTTNDGGYILAINNYWYNNKDRTYLIKLDAAWNIEWNREIYENNYFYSGRFYDVKQTSDNGYILVGYNHGDTWIIKTDSLGRYKTNTIQGNVFTDYDNSCALDSTDIALQNVILTFESTTTATEYYTKTDTNGFYSVDVPKGIYSISLNSPFPFFDTLCPVDSTITFLLPEITDTFDLPLAPTISCPMATVNIAAMILRRGLPSYYVANYCNHGTADAQGVYIEIELDTYFNLDSTSVPFSSQIGNIYTFNVGHLPVGDCHQIFLYGTIDTSAILGQTHCTEARIFPDSVCIPNFWTGPIMKASSNCQNDSVIFRVENIGTSNANNLAYSVYEDHVIFSIGTITLGSGATTIFNQPAAPGKTYRMEVNQANGFPPILGSSKTIAFQEGCNSYTNGSFNTGYVTQFYNGNSSPFVSLNCMENRGSWDPNDKQAQPKGYDMSHYIEANTPLTYKIRFQNTGTDTAFRVLIIDTLSQHLDPSTIQMQVSSHGYTWELSSQGVLKVIYNNIMLPDSNVNELASHGFIEFTIHQKENLPIGTVINNKAEIYFDFNYPIITNQTYHTIEDNFVTIILNTNTPTDFKKSLEIMLHPNPFHTYTTLSIKGATEESLSLNVYDLMGKLVHRYVAPKIDPTGCINIQINRNELPQGVYIFQLSGDKTLLQTGKMIVR